ncbi:hypothetical protein [Nocardia grenadensis]
MSFWEALWLIEVSFALVAYLLLIVLPLLTSVVYLIVRGRGMIDRASADAEQVGAAQRKSIQQTAGISPAAQISEAKRLPAEGMVTGSEFERLEAKAMS